MIFFSDRSQLNANVCALSSVQGSANRAGPTSNPKPIEKKSQTTTPIIKRADLTSALTAVPSTSKSTSQSVDKAASTSNPKPIIKPADLTSALAAVPSAVPSTSKSTSQSVDFKADKEASASNPKPIIKPADLTAALVAVQGEITQSTSQSGDVPTTVSLRRLSLGLSMKAKEVTIKHETEVDVHSTYDQNSKRIQEIFNQIGSNDPNTPPDTTSEAQAKADQEADDCEMINSDGPFPLPMLANTDGFIKFENDTISGNFPFIMTVSEVVLIDRLFVYIF